MTYVEAISEIQKRSVDALKVVQSTQIVSLQVTRDLTVALVAPPMALFGVTPIVGAMANLTGSLALQLFDQQIACAKSLTETLVGPARPLTSLSNQPIALAAAAPLEFAQLTKPLALTPPSLNPVAERETVEDIVETVAAPTSAFEAPAGHLPEAEAASTDSSLLDAVIEGAVIEHAIVDTQAADVPTVPPPPLADVPKVTRKKPKAPTVSNNRARSKRGPSK